MHILQTPITSREKGHKCLSQPNMDTHTYTHSSYLTQGKQGKNKLHIKGFSWEYRMIHSAGKDVTCFIKPDRWQNIQGDELP